MKHKCARSVRCAKYWQERKRWKCAWKPTKPGGTPGLSKLLKRFDYWCLKRVERGVVLTYVQRISGYSRAQVTRLVSRWVAGKRLVKQYRVPEQAFAKVYAVVDVALLVEVDQYMGTLPVSGQPAA